MQVAIATAIAITSLAHRGSRRLNPAIRAAPVSGTTTDAGMTAEADVKSVGAVASDEMILDIGPDSAEQMAALVASAGTILWNGPVGVFEFEQFGEGTRTLANAIARSNAFSLAGGGDTLAAIEKYGIAESISYISTGGGAFLEFVEGKKLPAVEILERRAA